MSLSCAHFKNSAIRPFKEKLITENITEFSRKFDIRADRIFIGKHQEFISNHKKISLLKLLTDSNSNDTSEYVVPVFSDDTISFHFYQNKKITEVIEIEAKLKRNGFIRLKNTKTNCQGIPYLFGGCDQEKMRIAFSSEGQMIVHQAVSNTGALLFIFGTGHSYNAVYFFEEKN
jgi:hypothetical protein